MSKQLTPSEDLKRGLELMAPQFKMALPSHVTQEKFIRAIQTAVGNNPALLQANRQSLYSAAMRAAEVGLMPDGKFSALVCYGDKVNFMIMIAGTLRLLRNSGELSTISAEIIYKNDVFEYWTDTEGPHLMHKPTMFGDRGDQVGAFAFAKMKDGSIYIEVMDMNQLNKIKKLSKSPDKGPWSQFPEEMQKKTILRRLAKRLPMSSDLDQTLSKEDEDEFVHNEPKTQPAQSSPQSEQQDDVIDVSPAPEAKKSKLEKIVEASEVPI